MKPTKTWIVMTDAQTVRIAENDGPGKGIFGLSTQGLKAPQITELSDAPGMTSAPAGPNRGGISDPDLKGQAAAAFADDIVKYLDVALRGDQFQRLVLAASPAMLGILRKKLSKPLQKVMLAEIPKDLTHLPLDNLPDHLADVMVV